MRILIAFLALTIPAVAQEVQIPACAPHDEMAAALLSKAKESPVGIGITRDRSLLEVYASEIGTWTVVQTDMTSGESCIKAFGTAWTMRPMPSKERGATR